MDGSPPNQDPRPRWRGRAGATALSAAAHIGLAAMLLLGWRTPAPPAFQPAVDVTLVPALPTPPKPPAPRAPARKRAARPARRAAERKLAAAHVMRRRRDRPPPLLARRSAAPPRAESPPAAVVEASEAGAGAGVSDAQLAGAQSAGDGDGPGGGGGDCDMARRVQAALRKDPLARAAVHAAGGRAIMIWNGDWVRSSAEDGKGLAAVREAITFEVAFAPPACRHQRVRGLIVLSLADGSARLALGAGDWRWSDLLGLR